MNKLQRKDIQRTDLKNRDEGQSNTYLGLNNKCGSVAQSVEHDE
ncbi:hypothetical protein [Robertmurraya sp. P23]